MLFAYPDADDRTLLKVENLHMFYENYKMGDWGKISQFFSCDAEKPVTNEQITGIYEYLEFIVDK